MSARNIGGVMAKYTMSMPKKKRLLSKDDIHYEEKIASGEYGGPISDGGHISKSKIWQAGY